MFAYTLFAYAVLGTSDKNRTFHLYGVGVSTEEKSENFEIIFKLMKKGCEDLGGLNPSILIADCAESITSGFVKLSERNLFVCTAFSM